MNNIQIKGIDSTLSQVVFENIQNLKQELNSILIRADQILIENLIDETKFRLEQAQDNSKTYQERYLIFNRLTESWFELWKQSKDLPDALNLIIIIDHITSYLTAYSYLFISLYLINEDKTGEYQKDLERIVSGFLLLSEIIDVFIVFFSISELKRIYDGSKNAFSVSTRSVSEYFENRKTSNLVTQLRAYSSLIILNIEDYINKEEITRETESTQLKNKVEIDSSSKPWWEQITGTFANNTVYDEAMQLGREYRDLPQPHSTESLDV
ncbi:hypothetical protein [Chroococcus sp. FPU101]|uniref:hypothetical protein n=1 Tax=Chroococcus sp. FPU101 TaxID=1974212 RepID=UPI001AAAE999|nr:hypothetical protein [Chroococcus sp. FPU101]GFE71233.1 hypothetical protein CFPU101_38430 [Chroococcus sp. FPU101]